MMGRQAELGAEAAPAAAKEWETWDSWAKEYGGDDGEEDLDGIHGSGAFKDMWNEMAGEGSKAKDKRRAKNMGKGEKGRGGPRLSVANLPFNVDWKYLKDLFRDAGIDVKHADVAEDPKTGRSKGHAVVEVAGQGDVELAIETLNEVDIDGRKILVREDRDGGKGDPGEKGGGKADGKGKSWTKGRAALPSAELPVRPSSIFDEPADFREERPRLSFPPPGPGVARLLIENLPPTYTWQRVKDLVRDAGFNVLHTDMIEAYVGVAVAHLPNHEEVAAAASELQVRM